MYIIPKESYEMVASTLSTRTEDTHLICQALKGRKGEIIEVWADEKDDPEVVLVKSKGDRRFFEGGMQIFVTARYEAAAEKLLEHLDKKPATFLFQGRDLSAIISKWYELSEDTGHYYYRIRRGELQKRMIWPTVQLGPEHESIVRRSEDVGDLLRAYKKSLSRRSFATFAVIEMSEVQSYCHIGEGHVGDIFTREDKRRFGLGQSVLSAAVEGGRLVFVVSTFFLGLVYGWVAYGTGSVKWTALSHSLNGILALGAPISTSILALISGLPG